MEMGWRTWERGGWGRRGDKDLVTGLSKFQNLVAPSHFVGKSFKVPSPKIDFYKQDLKASFSPSVRHPKLQIPPPPTKYCGHLCHHTAGGTRASSSSPVAPRTPLPPPKMHRKVAGGLELHPHRRHPHALQPLLLASRLQAPSSALRPPLPNGRREAMPLSLAPASERKGKREVGCATDNWDPSLLNLFLVTEMPRRIKPPSKPL